MRRAALTFLATVVGLVLLLSYKTHGTPALGRPGALAPLVPGPAAPTGTPAPGGSSGPTQKRTVTGQVVDTPYGPVQVQLTLSGRRIVDVQPLQLPQDLQRDIEIDNFAVPQLIQETLAAQSARIDLVSGATYTSEGYVQSVQSALDQLAG